jgi:hypothetical protein
VRLKVEMVSSKRLVGGLYGVLISSRVFSLPLGCSLRLSGILGNEVVDTQDDSWKGCFVMSLPSDEACPLGAGGGGGRGWVSLPPAPAYDP